jgi:hypothetical protein
MSRLSGTWSPKAAGVRLGTFLQKLNHTQTVDDTLLTSNRGSRARPGHYYFCTRPAYSLRVDASESPQAPVPERRSQLYGDRRNWPGGIACIPVGHVVVIDHTNRDFVYCLLCANAGKRGASVCKYGDVKELGGVVRIHEDPL